mmetsp:Transcript_11231/g.20196  ORF Transcript_11231/g.20196 Transcript_11231/m.20196 type:complete len:219 (-) Transcript_11231:83-739(-)
MSLAPSFASRNSSAFVSTKTFIFRFRSSLSSRSSDRTVSARLTLSTALVFSFSMLLSNLAFALEVFSSSSLVLCNSSLRFSLSAPKRPAAVDLLASFFFASFKRFDSTTPFCSDSSLISRSLWTSNSNLDFSDTTVTRFAWAVSKSSSIVSYAASRCSYDVRVLRTCRTSDSDSARRFSSASRHDWTSTRRASASAALFSFFWPMESAESLSSVKATI